MTIDDSASTPAESAFPSAGKPQNTAPPLPQEADDDDLDLGGPLGPRQANANEQIVCEGGCE